MVECNPWFPDEASFDLEIWHWVKENVKRATRQGKNIPIDFWQNFPTSRALAAPNAPPLPTGATPKVSPLLEPNESYANFLARLETAISCTVIREETKKHHVGILLLNIP